MKKSTIEKFRQLFSSIVILLFAFIGINTANAKSIMTFEQLQSFIQSGSGTGTIVNSLTAESNIGNVTKSGLTLVGENQLMVMKENIVVLGLEMPLLFLYKILQ